jgi:hypothetical protein
MIENEQADVDQNEMDSHQKVSKLIIYYVIMIAAILNHPQQDISGVNR